MVLVDLFRCFETLTHELPVKTEEGSPQRSPLSPLIANIYLNEYDKEMEQRGVPVIRYADDIVVLAKGRRAASEKHTALICRCGNHRGRLRYCFFSGLLL